MTVLISELQTVPNTKKPGLSQLQYLQQYFGKVILVHSLRLKVQENVINLITYSIYAI